MLSKTDSKDLILGIDLGTEFTVFGVYRNGKPEIIPNDYGLSLTPSVVIFSDEMRCIVGSKARGFSLRFRDSIVSEMKRVIGLKFNEIKSSVLKYFPNGLDKDENDKVKILVNFSKNYDSKTPSSKNINLFVKKNTETVQKEADDIKTIISRGNSTIEEDEKKSGFYPEYICAQLLNKVKEDAQKFCDRIINKAIITVPADFSNEQRECTKRAGELAGLEVVQLINEPTAAALAYIYYYKEYFNEEKKLVVFDMGGGTCDITILKTIFFRGQIIIKILSTNGDQNLGGKDFDNLIIDYYLNKNNFDKNELQKKENFMLQHRLKVISERTKKLLASQDKVKMHLEKILNQTFNDVEITKEEFENICKDLFEKCENLIKKAMDEADLKPDEIDDVILVGGSTRIVKIKSILKNYFEKSKIHDEIDPDTIVALGAAILGEKKVNKKFNREFRIEDVVSKSLGIEVFPNKKFKVLIPKNSTIPFEETCTFKTSTDNQKTILINIFEGEEETVDKNKHLGKFKLTNIPPKKKGEVKIDVFFRVDENGILEVSAREKEKEDNCNKIKIINMKQNSLNINIVQKIVENDSQISDILKSFNKQILSAKKEEKFDLYLELIKKIHLIFDDDYLKKLEKEENKLDFFIIQIQFLFNQYSLMFAYKELKNDDEIIKDIKIHIFKYLTFILDHIKDVSKFNVVEFVEDFSTNQNLNNFSILFISQQYFKTSLKTLDESYKIIKEDEPDLIKKHELIRKADFFLNEAETRLNLETVIDSVSNVSENVTNFFNDLKHKIHVYKLKCSVKERLALGVKVLHFMFSTQINVTEKFKGSLQFVDDAYNNYLMNEKVLHQNNDQFFKKEDYGDLLQIFNVKRIGNIILKDLNLISEEEFNNKEKELKKKIESLNNDNNNVCGSKNDDLFEIDKNFLNCKKKQTYNNFIEFVLIKFNYDKLSQDEIKKILSDYFNENKIDLIEKLKLIYTTYNYEEEDEKYKIVAKIEGYLNNIKNLIKKFKI